LTAIDIENKNIAIKSFAEIADGIVILKLAQLLSDKARIDETNISQIKNVDLVYSFIEDKIKGAQYIY
jgi:hypothetical protein